MYMYICMCIYDIYYIVYIYFIIYTSMINYILHIVILQFFENLSLKIGFVWKHSAVSLIPFITTVIPTSLVSS